MIRFDCQQLSAYPFSVHHLYCYPPKLDRTLPNPSHVHQHPKEPKADLNSYANLRVVVFHSSLLPGPGPESDESCPIPSTRNASQD